MKYDVLKEKFDIEILSSENSFVKIRIDASNLHAILKYLKNNAQFAAERLSTIIAVDLKSAGNSNFELIYDLHSPSTNLHWRISVLVDRNSPKASSIVEIFKSAYFDECEIFDMFGIEFVGNPNLKRLLMPKGWIVHPMRKDYVQQDKRLDWSVK